MDAMVATDRADLLAATLDLMDEAVAVVDAAGLIVCWNSAAELMTGYARGTMLSRRLPETLYAVDLIHRQQAERAAVEHERVGTGFGGAVAGYTDAVRSGAAVTGDDDLLERPALVQIQHHHGHRMSAMLRRLALANGLGARVGMALMFHPVDDVDALPHGMTLGGIGVKRSQAEMEDRLDEAHRRWVLTKMPYGLVWITVDQGAVLRRTHGRDACEEMLSIIEETLLHGLRPTETLGRWGDEEFLVLAHERSLALLVEHAERLAGLVRTAEFRWWGDRVTLTVSIGVCQAKEDVTLRGNLGAAREAMQESSAAGGNRVAAKWTEATGAADRDERDTTRAGSAAGAATQAAQPDGGGEDLPPILRVRAY